VALQDQPLEARARNFGQGLGQHLVKPPAAAGTAGFSNGYRVFDRLCHAPFANRGQSGINRGSRELKQDYRALKLLVIVMGVMIVAGFAVVIYTIIQRASASFAEDKPALQEPAKTGKAAAANLQSFGEVKFSLPQGSRIVDQEMHRRRLSLRVDHADKSQSVHIFDLRTGKEIGIIRTESR
jgi:hypothetical protein